MDIELTQNQTDKLLKELKKTDKDFIKSTIRQDEKGMYVQVNEDKYYISGALLQALSSEEDIEIRKTFDPVNRPSHYADTKYEPIDVLEDWGLGFCLGNALKYIKRAGHKKSGTLSDKDKEIQDLNKAIWYLQRRVFELENDIEV